jgi:hypothetical protein
MGEIDKYVNPDREQRAQLEQGRQERARQAEAQAKSMGQTPDGKQQQVAQDENRERALKESERRRQEQQQRTQAQR